MRVRWTDHAKQQLAAIHDHIALDSERYALRVVDRLTRRSQQIARFPKSGRVVLELEREDTREVIETPYRIVYASSPIGSMCSQFSTLPSNRRPSRANGPRSPARARTGDGGFMSNGTACPRPVERAG